MTDDTAALTATHFADGGVAHDVLQGGRGPSVILLHEAAGLSPSLRALAYRLIACGFTVHVPVFYGRGDGSARKGVSALWCLRRELSAFAAGSDTPLANWVRALVRSIGNAAKQDVTVIGMCMTGGVAIAALAEAQTGAAVAAQPSLPFATPLNSSAKHDLGLSDDTLTAAKATAAPLLAARYEKDWMCPAARLDRIRGEFTTETTTTEILADGVTRESRGRLTILTIGGRGHSVFTGDVNETAVRELVRFLREHVPT